MGGKAQCIFFLALVASIEGVKVDVGDGLLSLDIVHNEGNITVTAVGQTLGFIGFGISDGAGLMVGSDIIVSGLGPDGVGYIGDYFGTGYKLNGINAAPMLDPEQYGGHQDVTLLFAEEEGNTTTVIFTRKIEAGDQAPTTPFDLPFLNGTNRFIWSLGPNDDSFVHHGEGRRGTVLVDLTF